MDHSGQTASANQMWQGVGCLRLRHPIGQSVMLAETDRNTDITFCVNLVNFFYLYSSFFNGKEYEILREAGKYEGIVPCKRQR